MKCQRYIEKIVTKNNSGRWQMIRRIIYWLNRKKRIQEKRCGQCCLTCPFYEECSEDR